MANVEEFIEHHGVRGMKWGIRRSGRGKNVKLGASKDSKRATAALKKAKKHKLKSLTNKEIKDVTSRMDLERKYNNINPGKVQKGQALVKTALTVGGYGTVSAFAKSPTGKAVAKNIKDTIEMKVDWTKPLEKGFGTKK